SPEAGSSARAALASEASGQRGHSTSARAGHSPEAGSSARAALASEASGQRGHSTSARAGHSPEAGSSARAALASEASGQRGHSTSARAGPSPEAGSSARAEMNKAGQPMAERLRAARMVCLIEVLYATGLRVSELVALPRSAAERNARMLNVRGKGNKERLVPLNDAAKLAMRDYLT